VNTGKCKNKEEKGKRKKGKRNARNLRTSSL
jgi:hypothetical protein